MANPTNANIHEDVGNVWDAIDGTTTTIVNGLIQRAQAVIKAITGTTSGEMQDQAIRALADGYAVQNAMSGLGPESTDLNMYVAMRDRFYQDAESLLKSKGYALDGKYVRFKRVNA